MKNKIYHYLTIICLFNFFILSTNGVEQFNFDITDIEILENGRIFKGSNKGVVKANNGIIIKANSFEYDKVTNVLKANGNVKMEDAVEDYTIFAEEATYFKNDERILTKKNSKASYGDGQVIYANSFEYNKVTNVLKANGNVKMEDAVEDYTIFAEEATYFKNDEKIITKRNSKATYGDGQVIYANSFEYDKNTNVLNASGNVKMEDTVENYTIFAEEATYFKNDEKVFTKGKTKSLVHSKYEIQSKNIKFLINENILSSKEKTIVKDNKLNIYNLDEFKYLINKEELRGNNVIAVTNFGLPKSDKIYFSNAVIDLKNRNFLAKDTKIRIHKDIFDNSDNDPRLEGVSSKKNGSVTIVNKGVFTSCKENENCPPWSIKAEEIKHDKDEKKISYKNAFLNIYDIPVLYFPKFFHPDPTVKRQSGFLAPKLSSSDIFGRSITVPYFYASKESSDFTFTPTLFNKDIKMLQTEYRKIGINYDLITDFGYTNNYKSSLDNKKRNINHIFGKFNLDLGLKNFQSSNLDVSVEKVSNDTYLKVFEKYIVTEKEKKKGLRPNNLNVLNSKLKISLDHKNYNLDSGFEIFENLQLKNNDRYQYVLPYYKFNKILSKNFINGSVNMQSSGTNELKNTNNLRTRIINDTSYRGFDFISDLGFKNNFNINLKNLNSSGKNDSEYSSSPQIDLMSSVEFVSRLPLIKKTNFSENYITPKMSFRFNPSDMKNHSLDSRQINVNNIFANNRLGISDTLESGRSLTLGIDYKKEKLDDINKYFEFSLATAVRDKEENNIPKKSTLNRKNSNLFGSMTNNLNKNLSLNYNFAIDNDLNTFDYNNIGAQVSINNFITEFNFIEENGEMGDANVIENSFAYTLNESNQLSFKTRRNRKINLTEYYNFVYEYKNDCLTAGITYNKTYYEDRDLKPSENLLFTVTIFPLTTYQTGNLKKEN
jgi:LPS-assembly protein